MAITKIQSESLNLADTYDFTGTVTGAGGVMTPSFLAYRSGSTQSISSGAAVKVQLNSELYDTDNAFDNSTNYRFTPQVAGKYFFHASSRYDTDSDFDNVFNITSSSGLSISNSSVNLNDFTNKRIKRKNVQLIRKSK